MVLYIYVSFFFFKEKTAYEMRISDWSSDVCSSDLEDGKKLKMLKRYLRSQYGMTPEEYRARWGLPADYPMVAPNYAAQRSRLAKQKIGRASCRERVCQYV